MYQENEHEEFEKIAECRYRLGMRHLFDVNGSKCV